MTPSPEARALPAASPRPPAESAPMVEHALWYAALGWPVFPCHTPTADGGCTCRQGKGCKQSGKHPRTRHGCKDATTDPATIRKWWARWPEANIGGATVGKLVFDADSDEGQAALIPHVRGRMSWRTTTGRGRHYIYRDPSGKARPTNKPLPELPDVHVRATGGYVILPPSRHRLGGRYQWEVAPADVALADAPDSLLKLLAAPTADPAPRDEPPADDGPIPHGHRATALTSMAGTLHADGTPPGRILAHLVEVNAARCQPPLREADVVAIVRSVTKLYPAGATGPIVRVDRRLLRAGLTDGALALLVTRQALLQATGTSPRQAALAEALGVTPRSVRNWQAELLAAGIEYARPRRRYVTAPVDLLTDPEVTPAAKTTALWLLAYANKEGGAAVGLAALARVRGVDEDTTARHLQALSEGGHLLVTRAPYNPELGRRERCNSYRFAALVALAPVAAVGLTTEKRKQVRYRDPAEDQKRKQVRCDSRPSSPPSSPAVSLMRHKRIPIEPFPIEAADPRPAIVETQAPLPELASAPTADPPPARPDPAPTTGDGNDLLTAQAQALAGEVAAREELTPEATARLAAILPALIIRHGLAQVQAIYACGPGRRRRGVA